MDRVQYARYVLLRLAEALAIALGAGALAHAAQTTGWLTPAHLPRGWGRLGGARFLEAAAWWAWPAAWAAAAHLVLGPKQRRPVYLRIPGAMYSYAGVAVDRNAGCRGGFVTGATGSGKTLCCILPRLHSLCLNESGTERPEWALSHAAQAFGRLKREHRALRNAEAARISRLLEARGAAERRGRLQGALAGRGPAGTLGTGPDAEIRDIDALVGSLRHLRERGDQELQEASDACRASRFRIPPWGGFVCGEKGNEWQVIEALLRHHGREEDLCLLRTRPSWAPHGWAPTVRFNPLSMEEIPADTFAQLIVDTGLAVEEAQTRDEFFVPQARDKIAWGIRLARAVEAASDRTGPPRRPSLLTLFDVLTVQESYRRYLVRATEDIRGFPAAPRSRRRASSWRTTTGASRRTSWEGSEARCTISSRHLRSRRSPRSSAPTAPSTFATSSLARSSAWPSPRGSRSSAGTCRPC